MLPRLVPILAAALLLPALAAAQSPVTVRADSLYLAGDYEEAVSAYRAALRVDPAVGVSWYRLGISLQRLARYEEAVEALRESADRGGPGLVSFEVARSYAHLGRPDSTAVWMNRALAAGYGSTPQVDTLVALAGIEPSPALEEARLTADKLTRPCEYDPRFRQFDFWLGEWEVHDPNGVPQGTNRIEKMANGCLLLESWTNMGGVPGHSINYYDGVKEKYVQTWVGAGGAIIHVEGNADESGAMVFEGEIRSSTGVTTPFRGRWSLLEDGRVRQFLESSTDGGATWSVWFDGYYTRVGEAGSGG